MEEVKIIEVVKQEINSSQIIPPNEFKESFVDITTMSETVKSQPSPVDIVLSPTNIEVTNNENFLLPKDYFIWSIVNLLFGNIIFGITGLIFSLQTRNYIRSNNYEEARINSKRSFWFNLIGSILTVIIWILAIIFIYSLLHLVSTLRNL
jgi:hypothetical protein